MALVKRLVKGSPLTYAEADGNLTYLDNKVTGSVGLFPVFDSVNTVTGSNVLSQVGSNILIDGNLTVTGDLTAMQYIISSSVTHFTESFSSGSTVFGDTLNDTHQFTGSVFITGSATANTFIGDGSGLTNLPSGTPFRIATGSVTASVNVSDKIFSITSGSRNFGQIDITYNNTSFGQNTLLSTATGVANTAFGVGTLYSNTYGYGNTAIGSNALDTNTIGNENVAVGADALYSNTTGSSNTAIGTSALNVNVSDDNTALGNSSGLSNTIGTGNTFVGTRAGRLNVTGSYNVFIGLAAGTSEPNSNKLYIANSSTLTPLIKGDFSTGLLQLNTPAGTKITGSLTVTGSSVFSGSATGIVNSLSISSNTASLDLSRGNFFTLQLVGSTDTYINPTNIQSGQTVCVLIDTVGSGTVSFPANVFQASGSAYVPTATTGKDIITLVSFDNSNLYLVNVKNLI